MKTKILLLLFFILSAFQDYSQTGCVSGNCGNGYGTYIYSDGAKYAGEWKDGKVNGQGIMTFSNGDKYVGEFKGGHGNGQFTITFSNGDKYVGELKDGSRNGQGTFTYFNDDKYVGEWKDNKKNGQGTYIGSNGTKYVGQFKDDHENGYGTYIYLDGAVYEGEFKNERADGQGKLKYTDGSTYTGQFRNGLINGQGTATRSDGSRSYEGECKNEKKDGQGTEFYKEGDRYIGKFINNVKNGQGMYLWADGMKFVGEWKDDKRNGQGTMTYGDGEQYVGEWKDSKKNGQGTLSWSNGNKYIGEWKDNIPLIKTKNDNTNSFAVVIGNKDYKSTKEVAYAILDAGAIKNYLIYVLGYKEGNIFYIENATKSIFETFFGTKENPQGKLYNNIKQGISDVFIYYAGHGAPGLKDNKGYFVPIDCDPQYVEQGGYSLDLFYNNISKLNAKSIAVVTDACFSGAEIFNNISPIIITVSNSIAVADNCVVLSSSTGSQVSCWYNNKMHGMFTYFFLKALQDKDKSDKNKDGKLTFKEIFEYISDKTEGVPYYARSIYGVDQTPAIQGTGVENIFIEYK